MKAIIQKSINNSLEKIIEDFTETLSLLKNKDQSKYDQMASLVFAKKRIVDLTENIQNIFRSLVLLKYIGKKNKIAKEEHGNRFEKLFGEFNAE